MWDSTHDSLLQTLQVLFGLLVALVQESESQLLFFWGVGEKERKKHEPVGCLWRPLLDRHRRLVLGLSRRRLTRAPPGARSWCCPDSSAAQSQPAPEPARAPAWSYGWRRRRSTREEEEEEEGGVRREWHKANKWTRAERERGGHVLSELINHPLLLVDLIPQAGQLLVVHAAVRLPLLARSPLREKSPRHGDGVNQARANQTTAHFAPHFFFFVFYESF